MKICASIAILTTAFASARIHEDRDLQPDPPGGDCLSQSCTDKEDCTGYCFDTDKFRCIGPKPKTCACLPGWEIYPETPIGCDKPEDCASFGIECTSYDRPICAAGCCKCPQGQYRCFSGDSLVKMSDGTFKAIKDIQVGEYVDRGGLVEGVMKFAGSAGICRLGESFAVTPDHKIYHEGAFKPVAQVVDLSSCTETVPFLYDLDTFHHVIVFKGDFIATDYSEHDGDPTIAEVEMKLAQELAEDITEEEI